MKFSIGDKVLLKRTGEEGMVTGYIHQQMFEVESEGVVFPVHADDLEHPYLQWFTEKKKERRKEPPEEWPVERVKDAESRLAKGVYLSLLPVYKPDDTEDVVDLLKIYMMNELPFPVRYRYEVRTPARPVFFHEGMLHAFSHVHLHHILYEDMSDQPRFHWLVAHADSSKGLKEAGGVLRIRPAKLFSEIIELRKKNEPMFSYLLVDSFAETVPEKNAEKHKNSGKQKFKNPGKQKPEQPLSISTRSAGKPRPAVTFDDIPRYELDLHIEKLVADTAGLSNADMLQIQITYLNRYLSLAIRHRFERMIIVHGLGRGVLRDAVHQVLREIPEISGYSNEWLGRYGFGATEVRFSY